MQTERNNPLNVKTDFVLW